MTSDNQFAAGLPSARVKLTASAEDSTASSVATASTTGHRKAVARTRGGRQVDAGAAHVEQSIAGRFHSRVVAIA